MEKLHFAVCLLAAALAAGGCRREDIRACDIEIAGLTTENAIQIRRATEALQRYQGVKRDSLDWHMGPNGNLVLSLRYDAMQIAQTNLRMAIAATGAKVVSPANTPDGVAGYLDEKPASVD